MQRFQWLGCFLVTVFLLAVISCGSGSGSGSFTPEPEPPAGRGITPLSAVQTIFNANCLTACHEPAGLGFAESGLDLREGVSYALLFQQPATRSAGLRVQALDGDNSVLFQRLTGAIPPQMPLFAAPLSPSDQALIKQWIDDGASIAGRLHAVLSDNQVSAGQTPIATAAGGSGTITLSDDRSAIQFTLDLGEVAAFSSPIIGAHIHAQEPGATDGPVIFPFTLPEPLPSVLVLAGTLTAADLDPTQTTIASFEEAIAALLGGTTYFQVHTVANPAGEIRGHIGTKTLTAALDAEQVSGVPVITAASGSGTVVLNPDQDAMAVALDLGATADFTSPIIGAHIHAQNPGSADGPVILPFTVPTPLPSVLVINTVLTAADLDPNQTTIISFPEAVDATLSGTTYFQVHTQNNPAGEIRGQILP